MTFKLLNFRSFISFHVLEFEINTFAICSLTADSGKHSFYIIMCYSNKPFFRIRYVFLVATSRSLPWISITFLDFHCFKTFPRTQNNILSCDYDANQVMSLWPHLIIILLTTVWQTFHSFDLFLILLIKRPLSINDCLCHSKVCCLTIYILRKIVKDFDILQFTSFSTTSSYVLFYVQLTFNCQPSFQFLTPVVKQNIPITVNDKHNA